MREKLIEKIVSRDKGTEEYELYKSSPFPFDEVEDAIKRTLHTVPASFGSCVMMSVCLVAALKAHYSVPSIAVLGDLKIEGKYVFKCSGNIPFPTAEDEIISLNWDGHCWVEIAGVICDLSIFRSAYLIQQPSRLKRYIEKNFGKGKGALLAAPEQMPPELDFNPKFVLNDNQIYGVLNGLSALQSEGA